MTALITLHLGSRLPKAYEKDSDGTEPVLAAEQPGLVKCRIKLRYSKDSNFQQRLAETNTAWTALDHGGKPAWVSGTDAFMVSAVAELFGGIEIREWEPAEGDD